MVLRRAKGSDAAEVLLVRRAKPPEVGKWTFPGGSLELGKCPTALPTTSTAFPHLSWVLKAPSPLMVPNCPPNWKHSFPSSFLGAEGSLH